MANRVREPGEPEDRDRSSEGIAEGTDTIEVDRGGIDVFDSLFVRQDVRDGATNPLLEALADWARAHDDGDARSVLPVPGVTLVTLFLDRGDAGESDGLLWYLAVVDDGADEWTDPDATVREASPLFDGVLEAFLEPTATVHAHGVGGRQLLTHATHPRRQRRYADHCGDLLVAPVAGEALPIDVAVTTIPIEPGLTSRLVGRAVTLGNWITGIDRVSEWMRDQTDALEAETMYSESLLLEPVDGRRRLVLHYYMEAESAEQVWDAYHGSASDNWEVRFSDWAMRRIFEDYDAFVESPFESDCEVLVHAVHPDRP